MIYMDSPFKVALDHYNAPRIFKGRLSAHLTADTEEELVEYARSIGMSKSWLQDSGTYRFHFDVTGKFLDRVMSDSRVKFLEPKDFARLLLSRKV